MKLVFCFSLLLILVFSGHEQKTIEQEKPDFKAANTISNLYWKDSNIFVCWENPQEKNIQERQWVQSAINQSWQKESRLTFYGWCDCTKAEKQSQIIRIAIADDKEGSRVKHLGSRLNNVSNGMVLNFTFKNWGKALIPESVPDRRTAIKSIAVHEFGHALGFAHQQLRDKQDCYLCNYKSQESRQEIMDEKHFTSTDEALWYTPCDPNSVMNYCNGEYLNFGILSQYDIKTVQILYGKRVEKNNESLKIEHTVTLAKLPNEIKMSEQSQLAERPGDYKVISKKVWHTVNLYIAGNQTELNKIKYVEYYLDPTFNKRVNKISNPKEAFRYTFYAWGNFLVKAKIYLNDNKYYFLETTLNEIPPIKIQRKVKTLKRVIYENTTNMTKRGN